MGEQGRDRRREVRREQAAPRGQGHDRRDRQADGRPGPDHQELPDRGTGQEAGGGLPRRGRE